MALSTSLGQGHKIVAYDQGRDGLLYAAFSAHHV